jgi:hypothetical protein
MSIQLRIRNVCKNRAMAEREQKTILEKTIRGQQRRNGRMDAAPVHQRKHVFTRLAKGMSVANHSALVTNLHAVRVGRDNVVRSPAFHFNHEQTKIGRNYHEVGTAVAHHRLVVHDAIVREAAQQCVDAAFTGGRRSRQDVRNDIGHY